MVAKNFLSVFSINFELCLVESAFVTHYLLNCSGKIYCFMPLSWKEVFNATSKMLHCDCLPLDEMALSTWNVIAVILAWTSCCQMITHYCHLSYKLLQQYIHASAGPQSVQLKHNRSVLC